MQTQLAPQTEAPNAPATPETLAGPTWHELRRSLGDSHRARGAFQCAAVGRANINRLIESLTSASRRFVGRMHVEMPFEPLASTVWRGELVVTGQALVRNPLLASLAPGVHTGPVPGALAVFDGVYCLMEGLHTPQGHPTAWISHDPGIAGLAQTTWQRVKAQSRPAEQPMLTERQVQVAAQLVLGETTRVIARHLGYSERTVERDVEVVTLFVGANSRTAAIARLLGAVH